MCSLIWNAAQCNAAEAAVALLYTAVLPKIPHSNSCKRVPHRPLRPRRGRLGTLLQQYECGIFGRTAVRVAMVKALKAGSCQDCRDSFGRLQGALSGQFAQCLVGDCPTAVDISHRARSFSKRLVSPTLTQQGL